MKTQKIVYRSAETGRFVTKQFALAHPRTTYAVPYKPPVKPK